MFEDQVAQFLAAYNAHDAAAIGRLLAPGGTQEDVAPGRLNTTPEEIVAGLSPFFEAVPDAQWREDCRIAAGRSVVVQYLLTGHLEKDLGPFKARGQAISSPGLFVLKFAGDRLVAAEDYWDPVEFGQQVA